MGEVGLRQVRHGSRVLRFQAAVIGAATSQRGNNPRWSELVVYKLADGNYVVAKMARSSVAHRPECSRVRRWMVPWERAADYGEDRVNRVPCTDCWPNLQPPLDPQLRLEVSHYQAFPVASAESAVSVMGNPKADPALPPAQIVRDVLAQCAQADPCFSRYADAAIEPNPLLKTTRTG